MQNIIVSIIVPVYNSENYIEKCIESILKQTFINFELILINDGSEDKSLSICRYYERLDSRIRVISQKNMGVSKTRQEGLKLARGPYITFIDADDMIEPKYLEVLYKAIKDGDVNVVCCNSKDSSPFNENIYIKRDEYITESDVLLKSYFEKKRYAYCIWAKLFKKEDLEKIIFPEMKYSEDAYVVQTIFSNVSAVKLLKYQGYYYRDNPNGAMRKSKGIQEPLDSLKCTLYVSNIYMKRYSRQIDFIKERLVNDAFSLLINSSVESKINREEIEVLLDQSYSIIGKEFLKKSKKGAILLIYKHSPIIVLKLLKQFYRIKHSIIYNKKSYI